MRNDGKENKDLKQKRGKAAIKNDRKFASILFLLNTMIIVVYIIFIILGKVPIIILFVGPILIFLISSIMYFVFGNSYKTGDYTIIAGYDKNKDDSVYVRKQLIYIELFTIILSIMCNLLFLIAFFMGDTLLVPAALVIITIDLVGIFIIITVVNKRIRSRKQYSKKLNQERE